MTLDGKIILDFESTEKVISDAHGTPAPETKPYTPTPASDDKSKSKEINISSAKEKVQEVKTETSEVAEEEKKVAESPADDLTSEKDIQADSKEDESVHEEEPEKVITGQSDESQPEIAAKPVDETTSEEVEEIPSEPDEQPEEEVAEEPLASDEESSDITAQLVESIESAEETKDSSVPDIKEKEDADPEQESGLDDLEEMPATTDEVESKTEADPVEVKKPAVKEPELPISLDEYLKAVKSDTQDKPTPPELSSSGEDLRIDLDVEERKSQKLIAETDENIVVDSPATDDSDIQEVPDSLGIADGEMDETQISIFYHTVADDLIIIDQLISGWSNGDISQKDLSKIKLSMRIMITHPLLKQLGHMKQLFTQVQKGINMLETNFDQFSASVASQNAKEMLKYIEKENILKNKNILLEQINEIGIKQHKLRMQIANKSRNGSVKLDAIREKIAKKNLIKDVSLLDSVQKNNRD